MTADDTDPALDIYERSIDTVVPETTIDSGPGATTGDNTPTFTFSATEPNATFECRTDGTAFAPCASPFTTLALADGGHTFEVRATDPAGNTDATPALSAFTIDTTAPDTTIDSGPRGLTLDTTATFTFSSTDAGASFECRFDTAAFRPCTSPDTSVALADGPHNFDVRAVDGSGVTDPTPARRRFRIDTDPVVASKVSISRRGGRRFAGRVRTPDAPPILATTCVENRRIRVKKRVRGRDPVVARARTNATGRWRASTTRRPTGRLYASVTRKLVRIDDARVTCRAARSRAIPR
jgi:hypothetical protein